MNQDLSACGSRGCVYREEEHGHKILIKIYSQYMQAFKKNISSSLNVRRT